MEDRGGRTRTWGEDPTTTHVDVGSWARFVSSLPAFLDTLTHTCPDSPRASSHALGSPRLRSTSQDQTAPPPVALVLTAPAPPQHATEDHLPHSRSRVPQVLRVLPHRRRRPPSPEPPAVAVAPYRDGTEVTLPLLDASGRALLGQQERRSLEALGWHVDSATASRLLPDSAAAAEMTVRILVEILCVAHPADLSCRLEVLSTS